MKPSGGDPGPGMRSVIVPAGNSHHSAVKVSIYVNGRLSKKSNNITIFLKLLKLRELVKRKLKGKVKVIPPGCFK